MCQTSMYIQSEIFSDLFIITHIEFPPFITDFARIQGCCTDSPDIRNRWGYDHICRQLIIIIERYGQVFKQTDISSYIQHVNRFPSYIRIPEDRFITISRIYQCLILIKSDILIS